MPLSSSQLAELVNRARHKAVTSSPPPPSPAGQRPVRSRQAAPVSQTPSTARIAPRTGALTLQPNDAVAPHVGCAGSVACPAPSGRPRHRVAPRSVGAGRRSLAPIRGCGPGVRAPERFRAERACRDRSVKLRGRRASRAALTARSEITPPRHAAPSRATSPLAFLASSAGRRASETPCASWVERQLPRRRVQRRMATHRPLAAKPLEKRRRPVRFAPIWPTSVHYSDRSRHAVLSRVQRPPRSTALGCQAERRRTRRRSSAAGIAIAPATPP
jgi:hypothetical protein